MTNGFVFLYNIKGLESYDESIIESIPVTDFYTVFYDFFGGLKECGNHKSIIAEEYKLYFHWTGIFQPYIEVQWGGQAALRQLLILAEANDWSILILNNDRVLINLTTIIGQ